MRDTSRSALIAVLAVVAVAVAAATLDSTTTAERGGSGGSGTGWGTGGLVPPSESGSAPGGTIQIPYVTEIVTVLLGLAALAILAYLLVYWREVGRIVVGVAGLALLLVVLVDLLTAPTSLPIPPLFEPGNGGLGGGGADAPPPSPLSVIVLLVLGLAIAGTVVALFGTTTDGSDRSDRPETDPPVGDPRAGAVGRAAGRAADRIEREATVDNEVYRAWREMTGLLDVAEPETSTPGAFADAATEAGLGREDVDELTRLFEDVRYGGRDPADGRERRAVAIFRRIERRYGEDDP